MKNLLISAALALTLLTGACTTLTSPTPTPSPVVVSDVNTLFTTTDMALLALPLVPGINPVVAADAKTAEAALKAAWATYQTDAASCGAAAVASPTCLTAPQAAVQIAIQTAEQFLTSAEATTAMKAAAVK